MQADSTFCMILCTQFTRIVLSEREWRRSNFRQLPNAPGIDKCILRFYREADRNETINMIPSIGETAISVYGNQESYRTGSYTNYTFTYKVDSDILNLKLF